jgi:Flp pilus assembly protein TadG
MLAIVVAGSGLPNGLEALMLTTFRRFLAQDTGATAVIFGLSVVPVLGVGFAAIDYSRAAQVRTQIQSAVDATALMLSRDGIKLTDAELRSRGQAYFAASFRNETGATLAPLTVTRDGKIVRVALSGSVPTVGSRVMGKPGLDVAVASTSEWSDKKIELALVLDNTGSMSDTIGGQRKIDALKAAALDLLSTLKTVARTPETVKVSIVPFDTQVKLDRIASEKQPWLRLHGIPQWSSWRGYVGDREQIGNYDVTDAAPNGGVAATLYPAQARAAFNGADTLAVVRPLTNDFTALEATIKSMTPSGFTNVAIGVAWGHATLSPGTPLTQGAAFGTDGVEKFMVVLTDGDNTRNSFGQSPGVIDQRTRLACDSAKSSGVKVYTIRLLAGNATLLRECATRPDMYKDVKNAGELKQVFQAIASEITSLRLTQ